MQLELPQIGEIAHAHFDIGGHLSGVIGLVGDYTLALADNERLHVANAVPKRRREYAAGRHFARLALSALGCAATEILSGARRQPIWPAGIIGSIAHSDNYALAIVGRDGQPYTGIGADIERLGRVTPDLTRLILTPQEQNWSASGQRVDPTVIFSAKEAIYKAINPIAGLMIGFDEVTIRLGACGHAFRANYHGHASANQRLEEGFGFATSYNEHVVSVFVIAPA